MESTICLNTNQMLEKSQIKMDYRANWLKSYWPLHRHNGFEIYYFQEGDATYIIGDQVYQIEGGDMLIFNGELLHRVNPSGAPYVRSFINFVPEFVKGNLDNCFYKNILSLFQAENGTLIRWSMFEREEIDQYIAKMSQEKEKEKIGYESMLQAYLSQLLIKIFRKSSGVDLDFTGNSTLNQKNVHVQRILKFINQNYNNYLTLDTIAESLHLNKYYMCHCFKEVTGFTINKHLSTRRMEEGKKLLLNTEQSVSEISDIIGLGNPVHFSRLFKQTVGISPQAYRKKYMETVQKSQK